MSIKLFFPWVIKLEMAHKSNKNISNTFALIKAHAV